MSNLVENCLKIIFTELKNDHDSLYKCILVNKNWCWVAIPILWKDPYSFENITHDKLYSTILEFLPATSKQSLINNGIDLPFKFPLQTHPYKPLFNYIRLLSHFPSEEFIDNIVGR